MGDILENNGGPKGAKKPYWKINLPGQKGWKRYDLKGNPITPKEAHGQDCKIDFPWKKTKNLKSIPIWCLILCPTPAY